MANVDSFKT